MPYNKTSPLANLPRLRDVMTKRASSWDRTGGNRDFIVVQPGASATLADMRGAGCINHIWCTMASPEAYVFRKVLLRAWWDDEARPSIETPIGDFFGMGHAQCRNFVSAPFTMSPDYGRGFNCWLPMPFATRARFEIQSECAEQPLNFYYYVDYEQYDSLDDDLGRLHAQWRRQNPCDGIADSGLSNSAFQFEGENLSADGNYVLLEAEGLKVRVVSMPSWELFALLDEDDQEAVLPADVPTLAVEAASSFGWDRWADDSVSFDHFGASAPGAVVMEKFGYTATNVADRARQLLDELDEEV